MILIIIMIMIIITILSHWTNACRLLFVEDVNVDIDVTCVCREPRCFDPRVLRPLRHGTQQHTT